MRLTEPTKSTLRFLAKKSETTRDLEKWAKANNIRVRRRLHSKAAERGASR